MEGMKMSACHQDWVRRLHEIDVRRRDRLLHSRPVVGETQRDREERFAHRFDRLFPNRLYGYLVTTETLSLSSTDPLSNTFSAKSVIFVHMISGKRATEPHQSPMQSQNIQNQLLRHHCLLRQAKPRTYGIQVNLPKTLLLLLRPQLKRQLALLFCKSLGLSTKLYLLWRD
jgi:hypothetical protein